MLLERSFRSFKHYGKLSSALTTPPHNMLALKRTKLRCRGFALERGAAGQAHFGCRRMEQAWQRWK